MLQDTTASVGTTWEFSVESHDNDDINRVVGLGVVEFDFNGQFESATNQSFSVTRTNGAISPPTVNMELSFSYTHLRAHDTVLDLLYRHPL